MVDSLFFSSLESDFGEMWKLFCELRNILPKALYFISKYLNSATVWDFFSCYWSLTIKIYSHVPSCTLRCNLCKGKEKKLIIPYTLNAYFSRLMGASQNSERYLFRAVIDPRSIISFFTQRIIIPKDLYSKRLWFNFFFIYFFGSFGIIIFRYTTFRNTELLG